MKVKNQIISKVYVIESLRDGDLSTGKEIIDYINSQSSVETNYRNTKMKVDFLCELKDISLCVDWIITMVFYYLLRCMGVLQE